MQCRKPIQVKHPKEKGTYFTVSCGQCLPCRIRKRDMWVLRNLLESQTTHSKSFWTLTFEDNSIQHSPMWRELCRTFFNTLRASEKRGGNPHPIRYFGCLEFGGRYGRPHIHLLIYNLLRNYRTSTPYLPDLPRPRFSIKQWPHGHVDISPWNTRSVRYVAKYVTGFYQDMESKNHRLSTIRPAIGYYGLQLLAAQHAKKYSTLLESPPYLSVGGIPYPMDKWTKDHFVKFYEEAGGKIIDTRNSIERKIDADLEHGSRPQYLLDREEAKYRQATKKIELSKKRLEAFEQIVTRRAEGGTRRAEGKASVLQNHQASEHRD